MTKRYLADQIVLRVTGGEPSSDSNVMLSDVLAYLPYAHSSAVRQACFENRNDARRESQFSIFSGYSAEPGFMATFVVTPVKDENRDLYYADLPQKLVSLPGMWEIGNVHAKGDFTNQWVKVVRSANLADSRLLMIAKYVWQEVSDQVMDTSGVKTRLWFTSVPLPVCDIVVTAVPSLEGYDDDDEIPVPASLEAQIIEIASAYFLNQRAAPADNITDTNDTNNARQ